MQTKVSYQKINELAEQLKNLSREIEDKSASLYRDADRILLRTKSSYNEHYVRSVVAEIESILQAIHRQSSVASAKMNDKSSSLKWAAGEYRRIEDKSKIKVKKEPLIFSSFKALGRLFGDLFKKGKNFVTSTADKILSVLGLKKVETYQEEPTLVLPVGVPELRKDLSFNPSTYSEEVKLLQQRLKELGYNIKVDGYFGPETLKAVNDFKNKYGLGNTGEWEGVVGKQTWLYLFGELSGNLGYAPDKFSEQVRIAQTRLKDKGYDVEATGYFDEKTLVAVNDFKNRNGLGNTGEWEGKIGPQTWEYLFMAGALGIASGISDQTDTERIAGGSNLSYAKELQEIIDKYVNFTFTDASGNVSSKIQLPYKWGAPGGVGKWSVDEIQQNMIKLGLNVNDPKLQELVTKNSSNLGIDCSGLVLQVIDKVTGGKATAYYKEVFNIPGNNILHWGVSAANMTSLDYSKKIESLSDVRPGDYIRFDNGSHIGIVYEVSGNTIYYVHSSSGKGPHMGTITVNESGKNGLNLKNSASATFNDWDSNYSVTIQSLFNYICRPNFMENIYKSEEVKLPNTEIENIPKPDGMMPGDTPWIPQVMQLNGSTDAEKYLKKRLDKLKIKWDQSKIDELWKATIEINNTYGIQIDPRLLLAIIIQEGTGSFNTSSTNRAADGQHGVETNYAMDLMKANSLIFGKILGYIYYGDDFKQAVINNRDKSGITGNGDFFQYANWNTPIIRLNSKRLDTGVYAGHGEWHIGVKNIYKELTYDGAADEYSTYLSDIDINVVKQIAELEGIKLKPYSFIANKNAQDSKGNYNGEYTISVAR